MSPFLIIIVTIMFLHLATRVMARKGSVMKQPCELHKWEYVEDGMKCSVCGRKPGAV